MENSDIVQIFIELSKRLKRPCQEIADAVAVLISEDEEETVQRTKIMLVYMKELIAKKEMNQIYLTDLAELVVSKNG